VKNLYVDLRALKVKTKIVHFATLFKTIAIILSP